MIQISSDLFALLLFAQACAAWVACVLHLRQEARLKQELKAARLGRLAEITEPGGPFSSRAPALPMTRTTALTVPLP